MKRFERARVVDSLIICPFHIMEHWCGFREDPLEHVGYCTILRTELPSWCCNRLGGVLFENEEEAK